MDRPPRRWRETVRRAAEGLRDGSALSDRLGGERHQDPDLTALLPVLRRDLIVQDGAVIAYCHQLRIDGWTGNFAALVEAESFGTEGPSARFQDRYRRGCSNRRRVAERRLSPLGE